MKSQRRQVERTRINALNTRRTIISVICFVLLSSHFGLVVAEELAMDFTLTDIDGVEFSLSDYRGKIVLLNFFATWCRDCMMEIPVLGDLHEEFGENLTIISISTDPFTGTSELKQLREDFSVNWTIARDTGGVSFDYNVISIPTIVIVDQEGYIKHRHEGLTDETEVNEEIVALIPEFSLFMLLPLLFLSTLLLILTKKYQLAKKRIEAEKHACMS